MRLFAFAFALDVENQDIESGISHDVLVIYSYISNEIFSINNVINLLEFSQ